MLDNQQGGPTVNWCTRTVVSIKNPWHSLAWFCQHSSYDQSATALIHCQVSSSFFLWTSCKNGWECRCQPSHFWASSRELETLTWVATYYLDEDHPRWSLFPRSGDTWSQRFVISGDKCLCIPQCTRSGACYYWIGLTWDNFTTHKNDTLLAEVEKNDKQCAYVIS